MSNFFDGVSAYFAAHVTATYILRVILAMFCGTIIGLERSKRSKEAGIRTHCIIACASALLMIVSKYGFADLTIVDALGNASFFPGTRGADPARIAAQVVSGISFLGAGVIFKKDNTISGLTTAAGIWATAAVGLASGSGMYAIAIFVTVLIICIQLVMHRLNVGNDAFTYFEVRITMDNTPEIREVLRQKQEELGIIIISSNIITHGDNVMELILKARLKKAISISDAIEFMDKHPQIKSISL